MGLTIIIVNWNTKGMTLECLESLVPQIAELDVQLCVVDNASSDDSVPAIKEFYPEVEVIENTENIGFAAANNQILSIAESEYVLLLNSDTLIIDDVVKKSVDYMNFHSDVGVMGCRVLNSDTSLQKTCSQFPTLLNLLFLTLGLSRLKWPRFLSKYRMDHWERTDEREVEVVSGCYMLVRRNALEQVGLLDESFFFFGEETDWCIRFAKSGWKVMFAPVGEIIHHGGGSARKLNYKRDIMLTQATVRLHHKHKGLISAATASVILFIFNSSRMLFWLLASFLTRKIAHKERFDHFRGVVLNYRDTMPINVCR
jgi:GT2 family glycosyltransferase